jgi:hypothetical protein
LKGLLLALVLALMSIALIVIVAAMSAVIVYLLSLAVP